DYRIAAQALLNASNVVGPVPGIFDQDAFSNALSAVDQWLALARLPISSTPTSDEAAVAAMSRQTSFASALQALQPQITALRDAAREGGAPDRPSGKDEYDCSGYRDDFRAIIVNGNANSQAQALAAQLYRERTVVGVYNLLDAPGKYMLQGAGFNRVTLLRS